MRFPARVPADFASRGSGTRACVLWVASRGSGTSTAVCWVASR
ncbi:hypothetical protein [Microbacterium sp. NC79]|nr:hypothetical protein [Microbacterium sp. NC79]